MPYEVVGKWEANAGVCQRLRGRGRGQEPGGGGGGDNGFWFVRDWLTTGCSGELSEVDSVRCPEETEGIGV